MFSVITPDQKDFLVRNPSGQIKYRQASKSYVYFGGDEIMTDPVTLYVQKPSKNTKNLRQQLVDNIINNLGSDTKDAMKAYQTISKNTYVADEKLKTFMSTGDDTSGNDALKAMLEVEKGIETLTSAFGRKKTYKPQIKKGISGKKLEENKSLKKLDKLIERVILEHINTK